MMVSLRERVPNSGKMAGGMKDSSLLENLWEWALKFRLLMESKNLELRDIGLEESSLKVSLKKEYLRNRWNSYRKPRRHMQRLIKN